MPQRVDISCFFARAFVLKKRAVNSFFSSPNSPTVRLFIVLVFVRGIVARAAAVARVRILHCVAWWADVLRFVWAKRWRGGRPAGRCLFVSACTVGGGGRLVTSCAVGRGLGMALVVAAGELCWWHGRGMALSGMTLCGIGMAWHAFVPAGLELPLLYCLPTPSFNLRT